MLHAQFCNPVTSSTCMLGSCTLQNTHTHRICCMLLLTSSPYAAVTMLMRSSRGASSEHKGTGMRAYSAHTGGEQRWGTVTKECMSKHTHYESPTSVCARPAANSLIAIAHIKFDCTTEKDVTSSKSASPHQLSCSWQQTQTAGESHRLKNRDVARQ